uniref:Neprosin PEP catalytic domain-containing protein n=1 Tax=Opuntia streptacantha TaxID=393608 RepID=A0A7C9CTK2_OPUST
MAKSAAYVGIGGETYSSPGQSLPPMGSGYKPGGDYSTAWFAHSVNTYIVNENYDQLPPEDTEEYTTSSDDYVVSDQPTVGKSGRVLYYGGTRYGGTSSN